MSDDILTQIDDTLTDTSACFCGCGKRIPANGASPWFFDDVCQMRWNARRNAAKSSTEEVPAPVEAAAPPATWTTNHDPRDIGCRNCGSWLAVRAPLCGPCSALPSCSATRWAAVWDGTARCLLPYGHADPEHRSVEGRTWRDRVYVAPPPVEALRPVVEATVATGIEPGYLLPAWQFTPGERVDVEGFGSFTVTSVNGEGRVSLEPVAPPVDAALQPDLDAAAAPRLPWWKRWKR